MRLILDTNVLVSALIQRSYPYYIIDRVLADAGLQPCLSAPLLADYIEVLNRPEFLRFPDFQARAHTLLTDFRKAGTALCTDPAAYYYCRCAR